MQIFDQIVRSDPSPSKHVEPEAEFLNRISGEYWDQVRECIEQWVARFPDDSKRELCSRLRDRGKDQAVRSALWEIYLHATLVDSGYEVVCHPEISGTTRRPDFQAKRGDESFYVEARVTSTAEQRVAVDNRRGVIYDIVNTIKSPNFYLSINFDAEGKDSPPAAKIKRELELWLGRLNPDDTHLQYESGTEGLPSYTWKRGDWCIVFTALPGGAARLRPTSRAIGGYPIEVEPIDDIGPIKKALKQKGTAYGQVDGPYIVAIASSSGFLYDDEVEDVLYGTSREFVSRDADGSRRYEMDRADDGYWKLSGSIGRLGVSGVLVAVCPGYWNWSKMTPTLWENPNPIFQAPTLPIWKRGTLRGWEVIYENAETGPHTLFGMPRNWPIGDPFPR